MHQQLGVRRTRANGTEARALALRCQRTSQSPRIRKSCGVRRSIPLTAGSLKEPRSSKRKKVLQIVHLFFEWTRSSSLPGTRSSIVRTNRKLSTSLVDKHISAYQIEKCYFEFSDVSRWILQSVDTPAPYTVLRRSRFHRHPSSPDYLLIGPN